MTRISNLTTNQLFNGYWTLENGMCFMTFNKFDVISELMSRGLGEQKLYHSETTVLEEYRKQATFHKLQYIDKDELVKLIRKNQRTISKKVSLWDCDISISDNILRVSAYVKGVMKYFEVRLSEHPNDFRINEVCKEAEQETETPEPMQITTEPYIETPIEEAPEMEQKTEIQEPTPVTTELEVPVKTQNANDRAELAWEEYLKRRKKEIKARKISDLTDDELMNGYLSMSVFSFTRIFDKFDKFQVISELIRRKICLQELYSIVQSKLEIERHDARLYERFLGEDVLYHELLERISSWENLLREVDKAINEQESVSNDMQNILTEAV